MLMPQRAPRKHVVQNILMEHVPGVFHASVFMSLYEYWQLYPQKAMKRESWVMLCLFMDEITTTGPGLENFIIRDVVCRCQDPSLSCDECAFPPWKAVFLSFQSFSSKVFCL